MRKPKRTVIELNDRQRLAAEKISGPLLVVAGAGAGKTRVLVARMAEIAKKQVLERRAVLAVTFSNKAAKELDHRVTEELNGNHLERWAGTFHSIALRIIRPHHKLIERSANFTILSSDDQVRVISKVLQEHDFSGDKGLAKTVAYHINRWEDQDIQPKKVAQDRRFQASEDIAQKIFQSYQDRLRSLDTMDFGGILTQCVRLLRDNPEILARYQDRFQYIMVDEFQDTNVVQYEWLRLLAWEHRNICCVGDDDQAIYSWRGADVGNILRFKKDFAEAEIIRLEQNYRSTKNILSVANGLISKNRQRMEKELWTQGQAGLPVMLKALGEPAEEAQFVAGVIANKNRAGAPLSDIAILVRTAALTRAFEERFLVDGIPYTVVGGIRFYERKEVRDAIAYLRLVVNPSDGVAFERIVNVPKRGIGQVAMNGFYERSAKEGISLPDAATGHNKLADFFAKLERWRALMNDLSVRELTHVILNESGYITMLEDSKNIEDELRLETLEDLIKGMDNFKSVVEFLDYISLVFEHTSEQALVRGVIISTIHAAKGLEFEVVFVPGFEEDIIPHKRALEDGNEAGLEEERRLCYVAITRARKEVYITLCNRRSMFGQGARYSSPSRFLRDLPRDCVRVL